MLLGPSFCRLLSFFVFFFPISLPRRKLFYSISYVNCYVTVSIFRGFFPLLSALLLILLALFFFLALKPNEKFPLPFYVAPISISLSAFLPTLPTRSRAPLHGLFRAWIVKEFKM